MHDPCSRFTQISLAANHQVRAEASSSSARFHSRRFRLNNIFFSRDTCESLTKESEGQRNEVLAANLQKIEAFAETELTELIGSIQDTLNEAVSDFKSVSVNTSEKILDQLHGDLLDGYKKKIASYDEQALLRNYSVTYDRAFFTAAAIAKQNLNIAWTSWLVELDTTNTETIAAAFEKLYQESSIGDESIWETSADEEQSSHLTHYYNTIDTEYLWENAATIKDNYAEKVNNAKNLVRSKVTVREREMGKTVNQELGKQRIEEARKREIPTNLFSPFRKTPCSLSEAAGRVSVAQGRRGRLQGHHRHHRLPRRSHRLLEGAADEQSSV